MGKFTWESFVIGFEECEEWQLFVGFEALIYDFFDWCNLFPYVLKDLASPSITSNHIQAIKPLPNTISVCYASDLLISQSMPGYNLLNIHEQGIETISNNNFFQ